MEISNEFLLNWSPDLRALADDLYLAICSVQANVPDPFAKICIVVNDDFTEKWLRLYLLLERRIPRIMMDLDFARLPEFVNDWLAATVERKSPFERQASKHPFSKNVLAWRIYGILEKAEPDGNLSELLKYVNNGSAKCAEKRYALSVKLAELYDDYLNSRFKMLREWERGNVRASDFDVPDWQVELYRKLAAENPETYAWEYDEALKDDTDAAMAFENGFPRYSAVFIFDVPFIPEPTLCLLKKMAGAMRIGFWKFNPKDDWLAETLSQKEAVRRLRAEFKKGLEQQRADLENARNPRELLVDINKFYDSDEERLLGCIASGARGTLGALLEDCQGNVNVPDGGRAPFDELENAAIAVHSVYSPRRELEAIRDGLHGFPKNHEPHEALVLCADWESYAPIIDAVFPLTNDAYGYIPIVTEGMPGTSPLVQSFENLLEFRRNRFEASAVFGLLANPAIREKYGLDENAVDALGNMAKIANIHWGLDDDDVASILGQEKPTENYPFTWRRGLDRMTAELLHGFPDNDELLLDIDNLGHLHPVGKVEGDRAKHVASLWMLVQGLASLRAKLSVGKKYRPAVLRELLSGLLDTFYAENDGNSLALGRLRREINSVAENMQTAGLQDAEIEAEVFIKAVLEAISSQMPGRRTSADAVQFAPLNAYTATPHKFIWVCGLNDGKFPRMDVRSSFDVIRRSPSLFDTTTREKDAYALLKAVLCAEERLALSYVGKEMRTNEDVPPSVLLSNVTDYLKSRNIVFCTFKHPLQGYGKRYFFQDNANGKDEEKLPQSYSKTYRDIAYSLHGRNDTPAPASSLVAFPLEETGVTEIALDELVGFLSRPNQYLLKKRLGAAIPWINGFNDKECMAVNLDKAMKRKLAILEHVDASSDSSQGEDEGEEKIIRDFYTKCARLSVETGNAPDEDMAEQVMENDNSHARNIAIVKGRSKSLVFACYGEDGQLLNLAETYKAFLASAEIPCSLDFPMETPGTIVRLNWTSRTITLRDKDNKVGPYVILFMDSIGDSAKVEIKLRHIAICAMLGEVATIAFSYDGIMVCTPVAREDARIALDAFLKFATGPVPDGYPDFKTAVFFKDDKLPAEWLSLLDVVKTIE